ncbi:hypothetical protein NQ315_000231 [Exocentrus adspersus]|uniref:Fatty acid synthase n=1 Tax=Exocentrus adspersus TaxID=1586481 RepID=A0AAV8VRF5_9CUCU|nr:hypothetical protein NQ315_000231 [Exocentrus adspersus]
MESTDEIVISGVAGRFPECRNVEEFMQALLQGVDLVKEDKKFPKGVMGTPERLGQIPDLDKFDTTFFGVHGKQAEFMDPRQRLGCEVMYECVIDAGYNPQELRGSNTGVYAGQAWFQHIDAFTELNNRNGYYNVGYDLGVTANRISYCFDLKGNSYSLDSNFTTSMDAIMNAVGDIQRGKVDAAMVVCFNIIYHPYETAEFGKLGLLSRDGKCKVFSALRDGYVRSEAVVGLLIQKKSVCRRLYASIIGIATNQDGYKPEGITATSKEMQLQLLRKAYLKNGLDPNSVDYFEAHATGSPTGDSQELQLITEFFCKERKRPLLVGSVNSNMGHAEMAAGLCSITKVLIAMETGVIPGNLHAEPLDNGLPGINEGKIKVVTENLPWNCDVVGVNNFGIGGSNAHIVLKSNPKLKTQPSEKPRYRLVQVSGRTEEAVNHFLDQVEKNRHDDEFLALVDEVHKMNCDGYNYRGYVVLGEKVTREVSKYTKNRPIWFVYTGMGAQWLEMGRDLMRIETFRNTIKRCADAVRAYDVDLEEVLTSQAADTFDNCINSFTAIAAVEIAMTDLLYSLGIVPDGIAGHSLGEVGCSYADGQISPEDAVLLAYARGYASKCVELPAGAMAAVGLSSEECSKLLPEGIFIACQNGKRSVTISGPKVSTTTFVEKLSSQGVFARIVDTGGLAYHSKYVHDAASHLYNFAKKILKSPKLRSSKWLSTSVAEHQQNEPWGKYNCAEYHMNNFCSKVRFDRVYQHVPENAVVIEVAPHGLLQAILKKELNRNNIVLALGNRRSADNEEWLLSTIGKIYLAGGQPNLKKLYNGVTYPVSRGTKMLNSLVKWDHSTSWFVPNWVHRDYFGETIHVNISDEEHEYLAGHNIDGRIIMPVTGYLELAWNTFAKLHIKDIKDFPVVMENVHVKRATVLTYNTNVDFLVNITKYTGHFGIFEGGTLVCSGTIRTSQDVSKEYSNADYPEAEVNGYLPLNAEDLYQECHLRRYMYDGLFQGVTKCDVYGVNGTATWQGNFVSFMDTMLHLSVIAEPKRELMLPTAIEKVVIDPVKHLQQVAKDQDVPVFYNRDVKVLRAGSIEITGLDCSKAPKRKQTQEEPTLESYEFSTFEACRDTDARLDVALQILLQNQDGFVKTIKIGYVPGDGTAKLVSEIEEILESQPLIQTDSSEYNKDNEYDALIVTGDFKDVQMETVTRSLTKTGMVLYQGYISEEVSNDFSIIYEGAAEKDGVYLLRLKRKLSPDCKVVYVNNSKFDWLEELKPAIHTFKDVIYLVSQGEENSGLIGLMKTLLTEPKTAELRSVLIQDGDAAPFSLDNNFYRTQLEKDLTINVLKREGWGTYVHLPFKPIEKKHVENATVGIQTVGDLSTLCWIQRPTTLVSPVLESKKVSVHYSALNFKDVMVATGKLHQEQLNEPTVSEINLGLEYSGITTGGKRVMGIVSHEGLSLQLRTDPPFTWDVPATWSLEDAVTVPCVYATCYYAMIIRGRMQPGESILIHAGTGGVGLAAISIALSMGCEVYTTVGNAEKRDYLKKFYPLLNEDNIGNSRNTSFRKMIMEKTSGRGVDLVLNSLSGELFKESLMCLAEWGRFLEIGKVDFVNHTNIDSRTFQNNTSFHGILLDDAWEHKPEVRLEIRDLISEGIKTGAVRPLPRTVFKENQVEEAFRFLSTGKHKGKVILELRKEKADVAKTIDATPKIFFDPTKSYILVGGLGGVGLELTSWLISRGATKVVLNSRRPVHNGYQSYCLRKWSLWKRITVKINTDDTTTVEGARKLVAFAETLGPVGGVFHAALVLKDALIENQTPEMYEAVFNPKIVSGQNLDTATRTVCPKLDHFVVFSSVTSGRGNSGQTNYAMANSALEQLCEKRREQGLPALAIQWGAIKDVGVIAKTQISTKLDSVMTAQSIESCLEQLEKFMLQDKVVGSSIIIPKGSGSKGQEMVRTPLEAVAHIMGIRNIDTVDATLSLTQLGMDSLMVAEIKQTLSRIYNIEITVDDIRVLTFSRLAEMSGIQKKVPDESVIKENRTEEVAILLKEPIVELKQKDGETKSIFFLHPIEGHLENVRLVASHLQANVYGLQCTEEADFDTVEDYAEYYIKLIKTKRPQGPYYLCGYSFGAAVAFEMGVRLEAEKEPVHVIFLDGSPAFVREAFRGLFEKYESSFDKSLAAILVNFVSMFPGSSRDKLVSELATVSGLEQQLRLVGELVSEKTGLDAGLVSLSAHRYLKRCTAGFNYTPQKRFEGKLLLIRSKTNDWHSAADYDLHEVLQVTMKGDHKTFLEGDNAKVIADKINSF